MADLHYRMDLDKTYLVTPYEERRALLKIALEKPEEKQTLPGMRSLVRSLKDHPPSSTTTVTLTIISASPRWMERVLRRKLKLDGIPYDELILKDHWRLLKNGRFRELLSPVLFKLTALLALATRVKPGEREVLIGDDWDMDPFIYTFYAALRTRSLPSWVWEKTFNELEVPLTLLDELERLQQELPPTPTPPAILIRRERRRGEEFYSSFGTNLKTYDDTLALALLLFDLGTLEAEGVKKVIAELKERRWRLSTFAFSWESLKKSVFLERYGEIEKLLREEGVLVSLPFSSRTRPSRPKPSLPNWVEIFARKPLHSTASLAGEVSSPGF